LIAAPASASLADALPGRSAAKDLEHGQLHSLSLISPSTSLQRSGQNASTAEPLRYPAFTLR
jgi:hypothetical protein